MSAHVAIVGAGMAGLAAALQLRQGGVACTLIDKSRGLGGRMATRRVGDLRFDHGAQFFTARGPRFRAEVEAWRAAGAAAPWFDDAHVGLPGMSGPARAMAGDVPVVSRRRVVSLGRAADGWTVLAEDGPVAAPDGGAFAAVILAIPAPQAAPIAESAGIAFPELSRVRYAPCWALMLAFDRPSGLGSERLKPEHDAIAWIARDSSKPGRAGGAETVVAHAAPGWSARNLELPAEASAEALLGHFREVVGPGPDPSFAAAHRWRYALVEEAAGAPCLWDPRARIGACGDWCLGPRVEAAFNSGEAMAAAVLTTLERSGAR